MLICRLLFAAASVLAVGTLISNEVAAQSDPERHILSDTPELSPSLLEAMRRDLGMTPEQIRAYVAKSRQAHLDLGRIRQFLGGKWAGGYLDRQKDNSFDVVVATTDGSMERRIKEMHADRVVIVSYSLEELEDANKHLLPFLLEIAPKGLVSTGIDVRKNRIVVKVLRGSDAVASELAARANIPIEMLEVQPVDARPGAARLYYSAQEIDFNLPSWGYCSAGFALSTATAEGMLAAGHCIPSVGTQWKDPYFAFPPIVGIFRTRSFGTLGDHAWAQITNKAYSMTPSTLGSSTNFYGNWEERAGAIVCKDGLGTGYQCANITATNLNVFFSNGVLVAGLAEANMCAEPGDSGGPVFTPGGEAQGIVSAGVSTIFGCDYNPSTPYMYYQPLQDAINTILNTYGYNIFLRTIYNNRRITAGYQIGGVGSYARPGLYSPNGSYVLTVDNSIGWIVLYHLGVPVTYFKYVAANGILVMQPDGNVAARDATGALVWHLGISGANNNGSSMFLSDSGELRVFDHTGQKRRTLCIPTGVPTC